LKALKLEGVCFVRSAVPKSQREEKRGEEAFFRAQRRENPRGEKAQESKGPDLT